MPDEEFTAQQDEILDSLRPGEHMVDLAGAFDQALNPTENIEEWRPGEHADEETEEKKAEEAPEG